jgi:hypothetical protein
MILKKKLLVIIKQTQWKWQKNEQSETHLTSYEKLCKKSCGKYLSH